MQDKKSEFKVISGDKDKNAKKTNSPVKDKNKDAKAAQNGNKRTNSNTNEVNVIVVIGIFNSQRFKTHT